ncbi:MAG: hypothetical protein HUK22_03780, partial [Thermoguttaceae bacterium]|nr:hypothetical protein [Thermoguttaceae bacterium]
GAFLGAILLAEPTAAQRAQRLPGRPKPEKTAPPLAGLAALDDAGVDAKIEKMTNQEIYDDFFKLLGEGMHADAARLFDRALCERFLFNGEANEADVVRLCDNLPQIFQQHSDRYVEKFDAILNAAVEANAGRWRVLNALASLYRNCGFNGAVFVDGEWRRAVQDYRNGSCEKRDRVRRLQILRLALDSALADAAKLAKNDDATKSDLLRYFREFIAAVADDYGPSLDNYWKRQIKTDLVELPAYESREEVNNTSRWTPYEGVPVDADGAPVVFATPDSFDAAQNNGERINYLRAQIASLSAYDRLEIFFEQICEERDMFTVATAQNVGIADASLLAPRGPWGIASLDDAETVARLKTGVKRFVMPEGHNFLAHARELIATDLAPLADERPSFESFRQLICQAYDVVGSEYENRRQYDKAAEVWTEALAFAKEYAPKNAGKDAWAENYQARVDQILKPFGRISESNTKILGSKLGLAYVYRNGTSAEVVVRKLRVDLLLAAYKKLVAPDAKEDLKKRAPLYRQSLDSELLQELQRLISNEAAKSDIEFDSNGDEEENELLETLVGEGLFGDVVERRALKLTPAPGHLDRLENVEFDLPAGAYLVETKMADGNASRAVIWTTDVAIVTKSFQNTKLFYIADAATGAPLANTDVEFLVGWQTQEKAPAGKRRELGEILYVWHYEEKTQKTDENGQTLLQLETQEDRQFVVFAVVKSADKNAPDRYAFTGLDYVWVAKNDNVGDDRFFQQKAFFISDRPIYRPNQTAQFKFWVGSARYDAPMKSEWAGKNVHYIINSPNGDVVVEKDVALDDFGGMNASFEIPA